MGTTATHDTDPEVPAVAAAKPPRLGVPWGLFVALGIYALLVLGYVWATYWRSAEYQAAVNWDQAWSILGRDEGRSATQVELTLAYRHLLEAARLKPEVKSFHTELERLNWRFSEKKWEVPPDLRHASEAVASLWQRIQQERKPILVVGLRDKGWAPEQLVKGPKRVLMWSPVGGLLVIAVWAYGRFNVKRVREQEKEVEAQKLERELAERAQMRRR